MQSWLPYLKEGLAEPEELHKRAIGTFRLHEAVPNWNNTKKTMILQFRREKVSAEKCMKASVRLLKTMKDKTTGKWVFTIKNL